VIPAHGSVSCTIDSGAIWGVQFVEATAVRAASADGITINLTVHVGDTTIRAARYVGAGIPANTVVTVPVAGDGIPPTGRPKVDISIDGATTRSSVVTRAGVPVCQAVRPQNAKLRLVYADAGTILFQRLTAMPRIRWAGKSTVIPTLSARIAALKAGVPANEVVLDTPAGSGSGADATLQVTNDSGDRITARVDAGGDGYLVVADAMQVPGWSATVDGKAAVLLPADHAMVAVAVPAGQHTVRLSYTAPGQRVGLALTGVGVLALIGLLLGDRRLARLRSTSPGAIAP
jgi:hypothetical protein